MDLGLRVSSKNSALCFALLASFLLGAALSPSSAHAQSLNCTLLAHVDSLPGSGSSCWGYVDPNTSKEYAIFGNQNGTAIYNLDVPTSPRLTGFIPGPSSSWREMKTYSTYCYVGTEAGGGMQVIDLSNPEAPFLSSTQTDSGLTTIHSVTIDTVAAKLYANGANGGCRIFSLSNPANPAQIGRYVDAYVHDSFARDDTLWAACINNGQVRVLDVSNPAAITDIVAFATERGSTHNCWPTEDRSHLLVTDETSGGRVTSWDITTLLAPIQVDGFTADANGDAHNVHVNGDLAYVAHYTSGLRVLDISDPTNLTEVGYYDTYPLPGGLFNGCWGLYCWFPSGVIVLSDIEGGMFLVDFVDNRSFAQGTVTDANTTLPLAGAQVRSVQTGESDVTDGSGNYSFTLGQSGTYDIEASKFGYTTQTTNKAFGPGETEITDFALAPVPSGSLSGVFHYSGGAGIPNAAVAIRGTPLVTTTDVNGAYSFPQVPEGTYTVALDFWTCLPESAQVTVSSSLANSEANFTFEGVAFAFNFQDTSAAGWTVNALGGDNASTGIWTRVNPIGTNGGTAQPEDDHTPDGAKCWVTGQGSVGGSVGEQDVDNGRTTLYSPTMDLSGIANPKIQYFRWYINNAGSDPNNDIWKVQISSNGGTSWVTTDSTKVSQALWKEVRIQVADYVTPTNQVRMRFIAEDAGNGSIVEAGVDDFRVWGQSVTAVEGGLGSSPLRFALHPNSPNPFNPQTEIRFDLPAAALMSLEVFSPEGRLVRTIASGRLTAGPHAVSWDGRNEAGTDVASGIYVLRLESGKDHATRKITLVK